MVETTTEMVLILGPAWYEWLRPTFPAILAVALALGTALRTSAGQRRSPRLHVKAVDADGPLLAGQHRVRRVCAAVFFSRADGVVAV